MLPPSIRILIVDDEQDMGDILSLRLKRRGMTPVYMPGGEPALAWLVENPADVVLLDVKMPGMDGMEVLARLRRDYPSLPVIMLSGHADMEAATKGMQLGAFFYQLKPVDLESLCNKIEDAVRQSRLEHPKD